MFINKQSSIPAKEKKSYRETLNEKQLELLAKQGKKNADKTITHLKDGFDKQMQNKLESIWNKE